MAKRLFDIVVASTGLIVWAVPFAVITLAVKLSSPGPVLFRQQRVGRGGRLFWLYKFRTMRCIAGGPEITAAGDRRVTPVGKVLRLLKLDELPQLWNVLVGDMSVIGPRPEVERFVRRYTPEQRAVVEQTPGLASLAQLVYPHEAEMLRGHPNPEEVYVQEIMPRKIAVDLEYEKTRTFWSDLRLAFEIVLFIFGRNKRVDHSFSSPKSASQAGE